MLGRQVQLEFFAPTRLLLAAGTVRDAVDRHPIVIGEDPANPHRCGHLVLGRAYALADQVLRLANPGIDVDVDGRVPEEPRRKDRDRHEGARLAEHRHRVRRQRHLGDVELPVPQHPEERLLDRQVQKGEIDAVRLHGAVHQRAHAIVVPACE